jgi:uncharacterized OsmC-like protein
MLEIADLKTLQAPLKARYRDEPEAALVLLHAEGSLGAGVTCSVETGQAVVRAGLHPATGGGIENVCSGDMLLQALVACAGVTMNAVATALALPLRDARVRAEGELDVRGTLGVDRTVPVGFRHIRLAFEIEGELSAEQRDTLVRLTERYCVILQTIRSGPEVTVTVSP